MASELLNMKQVRKRKRRDELIRLHKLLPQLADLLPFVEHLGTVASMIHLKAAYAAMHLASQQSRSSGTYDRPQ
jgi:hypothetical protein